MNKRGTVLDIMLHPVFVSAVVFGIILLIVINNAYNLGEGTGIKKKAEATKLGLLIDSMQAVPRELSLFVRYFPEFGIDIQDNQVVAFEKGFDDGQLFFYNRNPDFKVSTAFFSKSDFKKNKLVVYRFGNKIDFSLNSTDLKLKEEIFCPPAEIKIEKIEVINSKTADVLVKYNPVFKKTGHAVASEDVDFLMDFITIPKGVRIYVPAENYLISCYITSAILKKLPGISITTVPMDASVLHPLDDRYKVLSENKNGIVIGFSKKFDEKNIADAVFNGLNAYGLS